MATYRIPYLKRFFYKGSFATNVLTISTGIILGQGLTIVSSPIITRLYQPGDFGILEVYASLLAIFLVAASLKYEGAIPLPESDITAANVFALCMAGVLGMSFFCLLLTWLLGDTLLAIVKAQKMGPYIWLLPLGVLGAGTYQVLNYWGIRQKAFRTIAWTKISQSVGRATTMIGLGWVGLGPSGLLVGDMIGHCSGSTRLALSAWKKDRESFRHLEVSRFWEVLRRYKKFPLFSLGAGFLYTFGKKVPSLLLAAFYGLHVLGWFALAQWVIGTPIGLIGASIAQVYVAELAHLARQSPAGMEGLFFNTLKILSLIALAIVPLIIIAAPLLVSLVFGKLWQESAVYIQVLSVLFAFELISYPLTGTVDVLGRQGLGLAREILRAILMGGAVPLAAIMKKSAVIAVLFYGIAGAIVYLFGIAVCWYAIRNHNKVLEVQSSAI